MPVCLRPLAVADTDAVHDWARREQACRYQAWGPNSREQTAAFVAAAAGSWTVRPQTRFSYAIEVDGHVGGSADLYLRGPSTAEIAYIMHPRLWGRGVATTAAREMLRIGFADLSRHRIFATCDPRNVASGHVLQKIGMTYEGRMRGTEHIRDGWRDSDLYAILADEWQLPRGF